MTEETKDLKTSLEVVEENKDLTISDNCVKIHCQNCSAVIPLHPLGILTCNVCGGVWKVVIVIQPLDYDEIFFN